MKKVISVMVLVCLMVSMLSLVACGDSSSSGNRPSSSSSTKNALTTSEKKKIAEEAALDAIDNSTLCVARSWKYKIGTIGTGRSDGKIAVNGQVYLYDSYGRLDESYTFSVLVSVDEKGNATAGRPDFKKQ